MTEPTVSALPELPAHVHFIGVGGIGMSGLARILHAWGYTVTGSDSSQSADLDRLAQQGIAVSAGHTRLDDAAVADLVVMTAAVRAGNPELEAAQAAAVPVIKRARLLGMLANARTCVGVAGSHGKSSTSGMLVSALHQLGGDPTYAVGAVVGLTGANAAPGAGPVMVVEADEYDYSFLELTPDVAIITNIDFDHPDIYPDQDAYDDAFARYVAGVRPGGTLVIAGDDPGSARLLGRPGFPRPATLQTFGDAPGFDWVVTRDGDGWQVATPAGNRVHLELQAPGRHNARNATAALAALVALGYNERDAATALGSYRGVGRRFETRGEENGVLVIDDYAHHPTEVRATLQAARDRFPDRTIWAAFQPHTYSRTSALLDEFAQSFSGADRLLLLDIYAARETDTLGVSSDDLARLAGPGTLRAATPPEAARTLAALVQPGDVVLTLGAGDVTTLGPLLLDLLRQRPS